MPPAFVWTSRRDAPAGSPTYSGGQAWLGAQTRSNYQQATQGVDTGLAPQVAEDYWTWLARGPNGAVVPTTGQTQADPWPAGLRAMPAPKALVRADEKPGDTRPPPTPAELRALPDANRDAYWNGTVPKPGQTLAPAPSLAQTQSQLDRMTGAVLWGLVPEFLKPDSEETTAEWNRQMTWYMRNPEYVGRMNLPRLRSEHPEDVLLLGAMDGLLYGLPAGGAAMKVAAGVAPMAKAALRGLAGNAERSAVRAALPAGTEPLSRELTAQATRLMHLSAGAPGGELKQAAAVARAGSRDAAFYNAPKPDAPFPQYATKYPPVGPSVLVRRSDGKPIEGVSGSDAQRLVEAGEAFWKKTLTPEAEAFKKQRLAIMRDMEQNGYTPFFDPAERFHADPANYPTAIDTTRDALPKSQQTINKHTKMMDTPGARARLQAAHEAGLAKLDSDNWSAMGQLEDAFIQELGPEEGRAAFKRRFANSMAATTAGADPRSNYLMSQYGNYLDVNGLPTPPSHQFPYPIGGRYAGSNMDMFDRTVRNPKWTGFDANNPKRHDYAYDFLGHRNNFTVDEKITGAILPGRQTPPSKSYGIGSGIGHDLAAQKGVSPGYYRDAVWAGLNSHYDGPAIKEINDAIERTHRLTGRPRGEIVRLGIVLGQIPIYGLGGAAISLPWLSPRVDDSGL